MCVHSGADRKDKRFPRCTLCLSRNAYILHITKHAQLSSRSGPEKDIICFPTFSTEVYFLCKFTFFVSFFIQKTSEEDESRKASGKQIICIVNDQLSIYRVGHNLNNRVLKEVNDCKTI